MGFRISVILPTVDRPAALHNLLKHLEHQSRPPDEIVIIDQSSRPDDRSLAYASRQPGVRYHRIDRKGLPGARNAGVERSTGDVLLFLDDDVVPDSDLVKAHVEAYADPSVSGVGGRVDAGYDTAGDVIGAFRPGTGVVVRNFSSDSRRDVDHLPGGNMSFRRGVFHRIGGFDVSFGGAAIGEETDFCLRARRAGFRLVFDARARVEHLHLQTGGCREERFEEWLYWHAHNATLFVLRHARRAALPLFLLRRVARYSLFAAERGAPALLLVGMKGLLRGAAAYVSGRP